MSRPIKFRAWDRVARRMFNVEQLNFSENIDGVIIDDLPRQKQLTLMQFTGLKDKNGVEIYEGDMVRAEDFLGEGTATVQVEFVRGYFGMTTDHHMYEPVYFQSGKAEVIGNIYENPDLLEAQQ